MSKIKNGGLDQYGAEPFEQRKFGTVGMKGLTGFVSRLGARLWLSSKRKGAREGVKVDNGRGEAVPSCLYYWGRHRPQVA